MTLETAQGGRRRKLLLVLPVFFTAIVYLSSTAERAVTDYDEGYYAQAAVHMVEQKDWVTPYADGVRFLEKPPFLYWVTAASFEIFGINEFALRLPTALGMIGLVWIVMLIARLAAGEEAVFVSGLSTAFCVGAYLFTRETLHDIWLVLFLALAMYGFLKWYLDPLHSRRPALIFYAAMAGGFMCKSLIGVAFPVGIAFLFFLISRERPRSPTLHLVPGALLFLVLTVPWHWLFKIRDFWNFSSSRNNSCAFWAGANRPFFGPFHWLHFGRSFLSGFFPGRRFPLRHS